MKEGRYFILLLVVLISLLLIVLSVLSLFPNLTSWYFELLDFPRLQYLVLSLACLVSFVFLNQRWRGLSWLLFVGLLGTLTIQASFIAPYWLGEKVVPDAVSTGPNDSHSVGILIANVLMENRQAKPFVQQVRQVNPEMVLVMEVDKWWVDQLEVLKESYPNVVEYPLDNAYGMALYSKLKLEETNVAFLDDEQIPSIHAKVIMPATRNFMFHGVHPVAPVPSDKYPDGKGEKEVSLLKVGDMVARENRPSIVAGDFNDVSWSRTSKLFGERGRLYNVRLGRGLYNSFDAKSSIERWPLDHIFVTRDFSVLELQRLPYIHSDHFPMYVRLALQR